MFCKCYLIKGHGVHNEGEQQRFCDEFESQFAHQHLYIKKTNILLSIS